MGHGVDGGLLVRVLVDASGEGRALYCFEMP
jgi:hypothetical protein